MLGFACSKGRISDPLAQTVLSIEVRNSAWCSLASSQSVRKTPGQWRLRQGDGSPAGVSLQLLCHWLQGSSTPDTVSARLQNEKALATSIAFSWHSLAHVHNGMRQVKMYRVSEGVLHFSDWLKIISKTALQLCFVKLKDLINEKIKVTETKEKAKHGRQRGLWHLVKTP